MVAQEQALTVEAFLSLMRESGTRLSRNRNFDLFENPCARRAHRIHQMLTQLEKDLIWHAREGTRISVDEGADEEGAVRFRLEITAPTLRLKRTVFLRPFEMDLLMQSPRVARLLRDASAAAADP